MLPNVKIPVKQFIEIWSYEKRDWSYRFGTLLVIDQSSSREPSLDKRNVRCISAVPSLPPSKC